MKNLIIVENFENYVQSLHLSPFSSKQIFLLCLVCTYVKGVTISSLGGCCNGSCFNT